MTKNNYNLSWIAWTLKDWCNLPLGNICPYQEYTYTCCIFISRVHGMGRRLITNRERVGTTDNNRNPSGTAGANRNPSRTTGEHNWSRHGNVVSLVSMCPWMRPLVCHVSPEEGPSFHWPARASNSKAFLPALFVTTSGDHKSPFFSWSTSSIVAFLAPIALTERVLSYRGLGAVHRYNARV